MQYSHLRLNKKCSSILQYFFAKVFVQPLVLKPLSHHWYLMFPVFTDKFPKCKDPAFFSLTSLTTLVLTFSKLCKPETLMVIFSVSCAKGI